jgi:hypothetical protein
MEKTISLILAVLTLGFAQQILAQDASDDESERWSDFLPLNKEMAGDADLPLPFGIGVIGYWQEQDLKPKSIGLATLGITGISAQAANVESEVDNYNVRLDAWLLPFLNVYGIVGKVEGENKASGVTVTDSWTGNTGGNVILEATLSGIQAGIQSSGFPLDYDGEVYGIGAILAYQWGKYWGTIDYNFTQADLDISTSEIDTHTITPRIGRSGSLGNIKGSLWIGAMHQSVDENHTGTINFAPGVDIEYKVLNEQENEWNFLLGGSAELSKQWHASIEGGIGDRKQVMGNLTFRF